MFFGALSVHHALHVSAWARGDAPTPTLVGVGYAVAALTGLVAVVGLWQRAPWLRVVALPWGVVLAALGISREMGSTTGTPLFRYANVVVTPLLYLWLAWLAIAAGRARVPPPARSGT